MAKRRKVNDDEAASVSVDLFNEATDLPVAPETEDVRPAPIDEHFAALMARLNGAPDSNLESAARSVSAWRGAGHSCMPLSALHPEPSVLAEALRGTKVVGAPGDWKPLILDSANRLYLQRYWNYEAEIAAAIRTRCAQPEKSHPHLQQALDEVIGSEPSDQRRAAEVALTKSFCVITGGPGTGKTRTVAYITSVVQKLTPAGKRPRIALAAPTGKAAARIGESLRKALDQLREAGKSVPDTLPEPATLHRLLGAAGDLSSARYGPGRPIPADIVIVDEASMIDLALMWRLITALLPHARLILLGDKDQLASVEAGNVFGDFCTGASETHPLAAHIVTLKRTYRVAEDSGIRNVSRLIQEGHAAKAISTLTEEQHPDIAMIAPALGTGLTEPARELVLAGYRTVLESGDPSSALAAFSRFRVLCALRTGPTGVESQNHLIERILFESMPVYRRGYSYRGQPVMIMENDYSLRLFNGDVGIVWPSESDGSLRAFFPNADGSLKQVAVARLPRHETAWAMTVHKSQGSEFDRVLLLLPHTDTRVLSRELIYTAITRARTHLTICGTREIIETAVARQTARFSGLRDALWNEPSS